MTKPAPTIVIVDDQPNLLENLALTIELAGFNVLTAKDGLQALGLLEEHSVDLILADIAMPHMNGYQLYECVRENPEWVMIPFIFLTARALDSDIRYGKELGVDDYLTKPIEPEDLLAVVQGKLRRAQQLVNRGPNSPSEQTTSLSILSVGCLKIDPAQHRVWMGDKLLKLSAREFQLLLALGEQPNQVISPQSLIQTTHGFETSPVEAGNLLRPLLRSLRRKLGYPVGEMGCIENIRGVGYCLIPPK